MDSVSIVVPAYLESNRAMFEACLRSIANLDYPKFALDVVVVSPWARQAYCESLLPGIAVRSIENRRANSFSGSINAGVDASSRTTKYILLLSDDTILTRQSLRRLVDSTGDNEALVAALSNCDNYWKYIVPLPHIYPERFYRLDHTLDTHALMNASSPIHQGILLTDILCFYATFIPRKVWERVGELDEAFNMGYEDTDYCYRAQKLGVRCVVALSALIWHAGGGTGEVITDEMRASNVKIFTEKWGGIPG